MVGIFSRFSGYISKPQYAPLKLDKELDQMVGEEEEDGTGAHGGFEREGEDDEVEVHGEFKPIKHPLEPPDDDLPAKYPLPFSSVVNNEAELSDSFVESLRKITESNVGNEERVAKQTPKQTDRKRRYARDQSPSSYNIFQVLQQCKQTV
ncbi:hypothetical protein Cni_G28950 [Canna indica]|uniref:Uncharacterized protein n=1 Tax=Canna indica TaxID=4628 RepID=A0AAQ3L3Q6_9LILI|nr:hypothetical protein Cni_G28950 [Canna indica]